MDIEKYVMEYSNIVPKDLSDEVMSARLDFQTSTYSNKTGKVDNSDERVNMDEFWIRNTHELYEPLKKCFVNAINMYMTDHPYFSVQHLTDFRINKYSEGGFMSKHYDSIHHSHGQHYGYPHATVLLYLNEDYEGGEFIISDIEYNPKQGSAIIFPSNFMFPHEVKTIKKGTRYSIVTWLM